MSRSVLLTLAALTTLCLTLPVRAQTPAVHYVSGWNMVGGPSGTDLSAAQALYVYQAGAYVPAAGTVAAACQGYWAYFPAATDVMPASSTLTAQSCSLQQGWNMVGDPFAGMASLPPGITGYRWDPLTAQYLAAMSIPVGGAIWIYTDTARAIDLQLASAASVTITVPPPPTEPVQIHVGQYLTLLVPVSGSGPFWIAKADVAFLQLAAFGPVSGTSNYSYWWQAIAAGSTIITLDPACLQNGCALPSFAVRVIILP